MTSRCPSSETLATWLGLPADDPGREHVDAHIDECKQCRGELADVGVWMATAGSDVSPTDFEDDPRQIFAPQTRVGRYRVERLLGQGGMSNVYLARDPELGRDVALKVLREAHSDQDRLVREAQALAKLNHPNVLAIHDVGAVNGRVFIAMERVVGQTLTKWASAHAWRDVLDGVIQAGRGLTAAHDAGLVHRDFKPDNVMVGDDGRVRVLDFGLVAQRPSRDSETAAAVDATHEPDLLTQTLTHDGDLVGTPRYLAPELFGGRSADATSDQFSFCVAAYESLTGRLPFAGTTCAELLQAIQEGEVVPPPSRNAVPPWVLKIVERGLRADPSLRWPNLGRLVQALQRDPTQRRRWVVTLVGVAGAVALVAAVWAWDNEQTHQLCVRSASEIDVAWNDSTRASVRETFSRRGSSRSADAAAKVDASLQAYVGDWRRTRTQACTAFRLERTISKDTRDRRLACLADGVRMLDAFVELVEVGDSVSLSQAPLSAQRLQATYHCDDDARLPATSVGQRGSDDETVEFALRTLARARVQNLSLAEGAQETAVAAFDAAQETGELGLIAAATHALGHALSNAGDFAAAAVRYEEALQLGGRSGRQEIVFDAALGLAHLAIINSSFDAADAWTQVMGLSLAQYAPRQASDLRARHHAMRAMLENARSDLDAGREAGQRSLAMARDVGDPWLIATAEHSLGTNALSRGKLANAREYLEAALDRVSAILPQGHSGRLDFLIPLQFLAHRQGRTEEAESYTARALSIARHSLSPNDPTVVDLLLGQGRSHMAAGRSRKAIDSFREAVVVWEHAGSPPDLSYVLIDLGKALIELERWDAAAGPLSRAIDVAPGGSLEARARVELAQVERERGDLETAAAHARTALEFSQGEANVPEGDALQILGSIEAVANHNEQAITFFERAIADYEHRELRWPLASTLQSLGALHSKMGQSALAIAALDRALKIFEADGVFPEEQARTKSLLEHARAAGMR